MSGHIVLIGLSGSGKSTVGQALATRLERPLYDTDMLLAQRARMPVPELLRADAARFRALEEEVIVATVAAPPGVIATGGGVVLSARNRDTLRRGNLVVWLRAPIETLRARLVAGEERPLLAGDTRRRLAELDEQRRALYAACAHQTLDTEHLAPAEAAARIVAAIAGWEALCER